MCVFLSFLVKSDFCFSLWDLSERGGFACGCLMYLWCFTYGGLASVQPMWFSQMSIKHHLLHESARFVTRSSKCGNDAKAYQNRFAYEFINKQNRRRCRMRRWILSIHQVYSDVFKFWYGLCASYLIYRLCWNKSKYITSRIEFGKWISFTLCKTRWNKQALLSYTIPNGIGKFIEMPTILSDMMNMVSVSDWIRNVMKKILQYE